MSEKKPETPRNAQAEDERDPDFLGAPPKAPPVPGVAPSEVPQIDEDTDLEPDRASR